MISDALFDHPILRLRATNVPPHAGQISNDGASTKIPLGFVMLFYAVDYRPLSLFHQFLLDTAVAGRPKFEDWKNTQQAYSDDGANYAAFLYYRGKTLETSSFADLKSYSATLGGSLSSNTGREFADSSKSRRVGTIILFYEWGFKLGLIDRVIPIRDGAKKPIRARRQWTQSRPQDPVKNLTPSAPELSEKVKLIPINLLQRCCKMLGPRVDERVPYGPPSRDRVVAESGYGTGARINSLADVEVIDVLNAERRIDPTDPNQLHVFHVRTKGQATQMILVPHLVLRKWLTYIRGERAEICRKVLETLGKKHQVSSKLFLNHITSNHRDLGRAASKDTLSRAFTSAMILAGNTIQQKRAILDSEGHPLRDERGDMLWELHDVAANTFHHLRHTYVVMTYHAMRRAGHTNPWKTICEAIGHAHVATTIDTYAKHVAVDEGELGDAVGAFLASLDGE